MKLCSHHSCKRRPSFNAEGIKPAAYCKQHAVAGMVDVLNKRCLHDSCTNRAGYGMGGSKKAAYKITCWRRYGGCRWRELLTRLLHEATAFLCRGHQDGDILQAACQRRHGRRPQQAMCTCLLDYNAQLQY
ncbi:unnamed protein product [Laminaria digitata]